MPSQPLSGTPQRQTTVTKTTTTTTTITTTTTETQTVPLAPGSPPTHFHSNTPPSERSRGHSPSTTRNSITSDASHPDNMRDPLPNEIVEGFFVVLTGRMPGIFFSR